MSDLSRRQLLSGFLGSLVPAVGTIVLVRTVLSGNAAEAGEATTPQPSSDSLQARADQVAAERPPLEEGEECYPVGFVNGGFANGGGFRNGAFANGGGFRNGAFANGGGFRNGAFANGGGGGFRNGGFANGGGGGGSFRNGAFRNF